jgi:SRSO17 transposase
MTASSTQEQKFDAAVREELQRLRTLIAPRFGRPEVRERAGRYLAGLLGPVDRRTGPQIARQIGEGRADGVQRLLNKARWDADAVRDDLRDYVVENLGDPSGVLVLAEVGFPKKGAKSAGVERLRNSTTGRLENRQLGLFLAYASPRGWACIDRALYLPEEWAEDEARRREAGVPEEVTFATKGELARKMLERAFDASVPAAWVTGGETYGTDRRLRRWLEARGHSYVLAEGYSSGLPRGAELLLPPVSDWVGFGSGGGANRPHKWARGKRRQERDAGRAEWLLTCQTAKEPAGYSYHGAYGPSNTPLSRLVRTVNTRWAVEENLDLTKGKVGLDQYEVRRWDAWHRHVTLSLLAHAALRVAMSARADGDSAVT